MHTLFTFDIGLHKLLFLMCIIFVIYVEYMCCVFWYISHVMHEYDT